MTAFTIGVDEVGTGALAGPLYVCAFVAPRGWIAPQGLTDSKKMSPPARQQFYARAKTLYRGSKQPFWQLSSRSCIEIDTLGIRPALFAAIADVLKRAVALVPSEDYAIVVDGNYNLFHLGYGRKLQSVEKADLSCPAVSAASVMAKVTRDTYMGSIHDGERWGFAKHKGYGTEDHYRALNVLGKHPEHRETFLRSAILRGAVA